MNHVMNGIKKVFLYSDNPSNALDLSVIINSLNQYGISVEDRGSLIESLFLGDKELCDFAALSASAVVSNIEEPLDILNRIANSETAFETAKLRDKQGYEDSLYDGFWLQRFLYKIISDKMPQEIGNGYMHIVFTGRLFGTFDKRRYHARVILLGAPYLISTSGLVEAPAKPREYYFIKGGLIQSGKDTSVLDEIYRGRYIEYNDPKTSSILTSYTLQALSYELTGEAFCQDSSCCLFNAHWQEGILKIQYEGKPCDKCLKRLTK